MKKAFLSIAAAAATLAMAPAANAAVMVGATDTAPDGSFSFGFAGTELADSFNETFTFTVGTGLQGLLSAFIGTSQSTPTNDVDFTNVFVTGGTLGATPVSLAALAGEPFEPRGFSGVTVGAGTYTFTAQGTSLGANGSFGGTVAFATTPAVPEPATWALMLLGFAGMGYTLRRCKSDTKVRVRYV